MPEFSRFALEALRQPLESGRASVARANGHVTYPAQVQLVAAMNPCRCGHLDDPGRACGRAPRCALDYQSRISGPLFDRIDLYVEVAALSPGDLSLPQRGERSAEVAARVAQARAVQAERYGAVTAAAGRAESPIRTNAAANGELLDKVASPDAAGRQLLTEAVSRLGLTARGYHRILKVARTLADLDGADAVRRPHIAEALAYRRVIPGRAAPAAATAG